MLSLATRLGCVPAVGQQRRIAALGAMSALSLTAPLQPGAGELLEGHGVNWPPHALLHVD